MKKTQKKDAVRNIRKKIVSWLSIVIVTMLTVGVFLGCRFYNASVKMEGEDYFKNWNFKDIDIISSSGIFESEIEKLRQVEGVQDIEGYYQLDVKATINGKAKSITMIRKTERISIPELLEGELPDEEGELAVSKTLAETEGIKIGDSISLSADGNQGKLLARKDFKVTGIVQHTEFYLLRKSSYIVAADASFARDIINGGYLRALIRCDIPKDISPFSNEYFDKVQEVEERIEALFPELLAQHGDEIRSFTEKKIEEQSAEPRRKLDEARKKAADGKKQLDEGKAKLEEGQRQILEGEKTLAEKEKLREEGEKKLADAEKELINGENKLRSGKKELETKKAEAEARLNDAKKQLKEAKEEEKEIAESFANLENMVRDMAKRRGMKDLPKAYYNAKEKAKELFLPAMRALVMQNQKEYERLSEEAENKMGAYLAEHSGLKELLENVIDLDVDSVMETIERAAGDNITREQLDKIREQMEKAKEMDPDTEITEEDEKTYREVEKIIFNGVGQLQAAEVAIAEAEQTLADEEKKGREQIAEAEKKVEDGEKRLAEGRRKYEQGKADYANGVKLLREGRQKLADAKKQYTEGLEKWNEMQAKYEEGMEEIRKGQETLDSKIAEARSRMENTIKDSSFATQNRRANAGYITLRTNINTISMASMAFIILFLVISALVIFSTIVIIVDEQRTLAGTMKSLGFFNKDIRNKYLVYGLSATIVGALLGSGFAVVIESVFRFGIQPMYVVKLPRFSYSILPLIFSILITVAVAVCATFVACGGMLKLSAIQLMSGISKGRTLKGSGKNKGGSLYSRLIFRNMRTEIERVSITTLIIACSCGLIGVGFTLRTAFAGVVNLQISDVWNYDVRATIGTQTEDDKREKIEKIMKDAGADYVKGMEEGTMYRIGALQEYTYLLVLDQESIPDYYHVVDQKTGDEMTLPDEGILIFNRLSETQGINTGDEFTIYDHQLKNFKVKVQGVYINHAGRYMILSRKAYKNLYGIDPVDNTYLIHLNGADKEKLEEQIRAVVPDVVLSSPEQLQDDFAQIQRSYNTVVYLLTGLAILMSIFVLANLTNIFVSRRRKELVIMRVNGFSMQQGIGYLMRETLTTTLIGFVVAILLGGTISRWLVGMIEQPDLMLDRRFIWSAWMWAVLLEGLFSFTINAWVFRKVRNIKVTDINN